MTWQFTSEVLISLLTAAVALIVGLLSTRWWKTPGIIYFSLLMVSIGGWALFSGLESASIEIPRKIFWAQMQYIGISFIPTFWLLLSLQYTHQDQRITHWWVISLLIVPVMTIFIVLTEDKNHWLWEAIQPISNIPGAPLTYTHGRWYSISAGYFYLLVFLGAFILIRRTVIPPKSVGVRALLLLSGVIPPLICNFIYHSKIFLVNNIQVMIMIGLMISGMIYFWGLYYFQLLEYTSLSHDVIIDKMSEGVIVLDRRDRIHNINSTALNMLGLSQRSAKRKSLNDIIAI